MSRGDAGRDARRARRPHTALPKCEWLEIKDRKAGAIKLTPVPKQPEPTNLRKMKRVIRTRWGQVPLIDIVKETVEMIRDCLRLRRNPETCDSRWEVAVFSRGRLAPMTRWPPHSAMIGI